MIINCILGVWSTSSLSLLPGPLWPGVVVSVKDEIDLLKNYPYLAGPNTKNIFKKQLNQKNVNMNNENNSLTSRHEQTLDG